jgi:hypothetical protein
VRDSEAGGPKERLHRNKRIFEIAGPLGGSIDVKVLPYHGPGAHQLAPSHGLPSAHAISRNVP